MFQFKNFAKVIVSTGYDQNATSVVLQTGMGALLPVAPFNLTWWNSTDYPDPTDDPNKEIVQVTAIVGDTLTVLRNQETTPATIKNLASKTYKMVAGLTALTLNTLPKPAGPEVPAGTVGGGNRFFTLSKTPNASGWVFGYLNGQMQVAGVDFTISGANITMTAAPVTNDSLYFFYHT